MPTHCSADYHAVVPKPKRKSPAKDKNGATVGYETEQNISDSRALVGDFVFVSDRTADELHACNVHAGDLVFPHRGAIGQVAIVPDNRLERCMLSTSLMKLTCDTQRVDSKYVFYFFRSQRGRHALLQHASTVGTPGIGNR